MQSRPATVQTVKTAANERGPKHSVVLDGSRLNELRWAAEYTIADLARVAGVSTSTVRRAKNGIPISLKYARDIAAALGVDVAVLQRSKPAFDANFREQMEPAPSGELDNADDQISSLLASQSVILSEIKTIVSGRWERHDRLSRLLYETDSPEFNDRLHAVSELCRFASIAAGDPTIIEEIAQVDDDEEKSRDIGRTLQLQARSLIEPRTDDIIAVMTKILNAGASDQDGRELCEVAIRTLGYLGASANSAVPFMVKYLYGANYRKYYLDELRRLATLSLAQIGTSAAVSALIQEFGNTPDDLINHADDAFLSMIAVSPDAIPLFIEALKSKDARLRMTLAYKLGRFSKLAIEAIPALSDIVRNDADQEVRRIAARALDRIQSLD